MQASTAAPAITSHILRSQAVCCPNHGWERTYWLAPFELVLLAVCVSDVFSVMYCWLALSADLGFILKTMHGDPPLSGVADRMIGAQTPRRWHVHRRSEPF
jgi:hypothetical protein